MKGSPERQVQDSRFRYIRSEIHSLMKEGELEISVNMLKQNRWSFERRRYVKWLCITVNAKYLINILDGCSLLRIKCTVYLASSVWVHFSNSKDIVKQCKILCKARGVLQYMKLCWTALTHTSYVSSESLRALHCIVSSDPVLSCIVSVEVASSSSVYWNARDQNTASFRCDDSQRWAKLRSTNTNQHKHKHKCRAW